jgi:hypothetical protein
MIHQPQLTQARVIVPRQTQPDAAGADAGGRRWIGIDESAASGGAARRTAGDDARVTVNHVRSAADKAR